ncbi:MAG: metal ABC transporter permease [Elusimicrobiota bacterium]|jgi:ABC-type Mn2+/Zn2+ transport system permease subunit
MTALLDLIRPDFPLQHAMYASIVVGLACPLVGAYFLLRRLVFWGVALPQASAAGIAFAFLLEGSGLERLVSGAGHERHLAILGAFAFTLAAILALALLERRGRGVAEGRVGVVYAITAAAAVLLVAWNARGEAEMMGLLKGELIAISETDFHHMLDCLILVAGSMFLFQKEFLLVSFDRDLAVSLGRKALGWDILLYILIGATISLGVMNVGPLVTFGLLVLPPMSALPWARGMMSFSLLSSAIGGASALAGFAAAYALDLPVGPVIVMAGGVCLGVSSLARMLQPR